LQSIVKTPNPKAAFMNILTPIPYLLVRFRNELASYEVPAFRGAVIHKVPASLTLFHNHIEDKFRYRYPLIQYKRINGKAAIVCVGEGTEDIGNFFANQNLDMEISGRKERFEIDSITANRWLLQLWESDFPYTLRKWLPFSETNYAKYRQLEGIVEKTAFLENILTGNILSLCTGLGVHMEKQVSCKILQIENERLYNYKNVRMQGMDVVFRTNISLADFVGLGKGVSLGFGMVKRMNEHKNDNEN